MDLAAFYSYSPETLDFNAFNKKHLDKQCEDSREPSQAMAVVMSLIVAIGLFGNGIVFFVILVLKEYKKSVAHWYVLQLAIADTLFLLMLPFTAHSEAVGEWSLPVGLCKAKEGILFVNFYASIAFLTVSFIPTLHFVLKLTKSTSWVQIMSFDRYLAVTRIAGTGWAQEVRKMPFAMLISLMTWCGCIALATPLYRFSTVGECKRCIYSFPSSDWEECSNAGVNETACEEFLSSASNHTEDDDYYENAIDDLAKTDFGNYFLGDFEDFFENDPTPICRDEPLNSYKLWIWLNFVIAFLLPLIAICICYGLILKTMMSTGTLVQNSNQRRYRRRVTFMVLALVSLFIISWLPWYVVKLVKLKGFEMSASGCKVLNQFTLVLAYLNSALNPYFYSFMGSHFYRRFERAKSTAQRSKLLSALSRMSSHKADSSNSQSERNGSTSNARKNSKKTFLRQDSESKVINRTEQTCL